MRQKATLGRWGESLAVRIPREAGRLAGFRPGTPVEIEARQGEVVLRAATPSYTLAELLEGTTPEAMREAFSWGDEVGRETVD